MYVLIICVAYIVVLLGLQVMGIWGDILPMYFFFLFFFYTGFVLSLVSLFIFVFCFVLLCSGETWTFLIEEGTCVTDCSVFSLEKEVCPS